MAISYKDLRAFIVISQTLHMGNASRLLHMSASSLSRRLSAIEAQVGARLIDRGRTGVQLTPAGNAFLTHAEQTLTHFKQLKASVGSQASDLRGELTLYCSVTASYSLLAELTSLFREHYPNVHLRIHTGDAAEAVAQVEQGHADVAVAAKPDELSQSLSFKIMAISPLVLIAPKTSGVMANEAMHLEHWKTTPVILSERGLARTRMDKWFAEQCVQPNVYAQVSGNEAIVAMVALGLGVGVVPELVLRNSPVASQVRIVSMQPELEPFAVGLCVQTQRLNEATIQALWKTVNR